MKANKIYEDITKRIISKMEEGEIPWEKPWIGRNGAYSRATGKNYNFVCQMIMPPGEYATFKRISNEGGKVLKGSKGYPVIFWKQQTYDVLDETGRKTGETKTRPVMRMYYVFNIETQTNLEKKWYRDEFVNDGIDPIDAMEEIKDDYIERSGVGFSEVESGEAFYDPREDYVQVPAKHQFSKESEYYSTVFHELAHSTGYETRLARNTDKKTSFGSEEYSREELVAELTSCSILANMGIETESSFRNSTAYIQNWMKALKNDKKMLVWASGRAEKAYNLIMGKSEGEEK